MSPPGSVTIREDQEGRRLRLLRQGVTDNSRRMKIMRSMGLLLVSASNLAFVNQKWERTKWKGRMIPNLPGILSDLAAARTPPARRFQGRPALIDNGDLRRSISVRTVGTDHVTVGTVKPYAAALHFGKPSKTSPVTKLVQERLAEWISKNESAGSKAAKRLAMLRKKKRAKAQYRGSPVTATQIAQQQSRYSLAQSKEESIEKLRFLLSGKYRNKRLTINHPARPFLGVTKAVRAAMDEAFKAAMTGSGGGTQ